MHPVKLPAGYRLPKGTTMADVRCLDQELLASEGLEAQGHKAKGGREEVPPEEGVAPRVSDGRRLGSDSRPWSE